MDNLNLLWVVVSRDKDLILMYNRSLILNNFSSKCNIQVNIRSTNKEITSSLTFFKSVYYFRYHEYNE